MSKLRTHFTLRVDTWTPDGESIVEHVAGVEDYQVALATYPAACERWLGAPITVRQGARVIEDSRRLRLAWSDKGREGGVRTSLPQRHHRRTRTELRAGDVRGDGSIIPSTQKGGASNE